MFGHTREPAPPKLNGKLDESFRAFRIQKRTDVASEKIPARIIPAWAESRSEVGFECVGDDLLMLDACPRPRGVERRSNCRPKAVRPGKM